MCIRDRINAGDGGHMHPTQTTTDLTTITRLRGGVDGLSVGLCGDLKNGRTVHSLIKALAKFKGIKFFLIAPRELAVPEYMRAFMRENNMWFTEVTGLEAVIPQLDVLLSLIHIFYRGDRRLCDHRGPVPAGLFALPVRQSGPVHPPDRGELYHPGPGRVPVSYTHLDVYKRQT